MIVSKFGGTSVKDANAINRVVDILKLRKEKTFLVVSALAGVTNDLTRVISELRSSNVDSATEIINQIFSRHIELISELGIKSSLRETYDQMRGEVIQLINALNVLGEVTPRSTDAIISYGEILSSLLIYHKLNDEGLSIKHINARSMIKTDSNFTEANIDIKITNQEIKEAAKSNFENYNILITGGFIASDDLERTTTLGRGGSDYTASVISAAINAKKLEIWTDVDGIMTSDPRFIPNAKIIEELSYSEASELAYFGAKVLHPKTIYPAVKNKIPVYVLNSYNPEGNGTRIISAQTGKKTIKAIAFRVGIYVISIHSNRMLGAYGFLSNVFEVFKKYETSVDLVTTSEVNISLTIDNGKNLSNIVKELKTFSKVRVTANQAIICSVGEGIKNTAGISAKFFSTLVGINISMVSIGASDVNISIILSEKQLEKAVKLLHKEFFE